MIDYSLAEVATGEYLEGKPIYRKIIKCGYPDTVNEPYLVDISELNIDTLIYMNGIYEWNDGNGAYHSINDNTQGTAKLIQYNSWVELVYTTTNWDNITGCTITLEYTKLFSSIENYDDPVIGIVMYNSGGQGGKWFRVNENGYPVNVVDGYFDNHPVFSALQDVLIDDNHMVEHSKFYYKLMQITEGPLTGKWARMISPTPKEGYKLYPSFIYKGQELDKWYCGKYQASGVRDPASASYTSVASVPDVLPLSNVNQVDFKALAKSTISDDYSYDIWNIYQVSELQLLMLIEHATGRLRSKQVIGPGLYGQATTVTPTKVDDPVVATATYRNHVGLWGNLWQYVDGIGSNTATSTYYLLDPETNELKDTEITVPVVSYNYPVGYYATSPVHDYFDCLIIPSSFTSDVTLSTIPDAYTGKTASPAYAQSGMLLGGTNRMAVNTTGPFVFYFYQNITATSAYQGSRISCIEKENAKTELIGRWIDGKDIYRKTLTFEGTLPTSVNVSSLNIDTLTRFSGVLESSNGTTYQINSENFTVYLENNVLNIQSTVTDAKSANIILEYTRNTDEESTYDGNNIFSLDEEVLIGTWINGKSLYRKVIQVPPITAQANTTVQLLDSMEDEITNFYGLHYYPTENTVLDASTYGLSRFFVNMTNNRATVWIKSTWVNTTVSYLVVEYIKKEEE